MSHNGRCCINGRCVGNVPQVYYCESIDPVNDPYGPCNAMSDVCASTADCPDSRASRPETATKRPEE